MRTCTLLMLLAVASSAKPDEGLPTPMRLEQAAPRPRAKLKLPRGHVVGPTIPGLRQGAVPQGLAYWKKQNWLLISCYFDGGRPSVVVALDAKTGKLERCLTLVEAGGKGHAGHVGGLAVSQKYLWVGSGQLYRAALADIVAATPVGHLRLQKPFRAECTASFVGFHGKRVWVGEYVLESENKGKPGHRMKDRNGVAKHAWVVGYDLDDNEDLAGENGGRLPAPSAVLSIRQKVQGIAFTDDRIILSVSYGRTNNSTLAVYSNPLQGESNSPHSTVNVQGETVSVWFLDGKNRVREINFPPMSEGITAHGDRLEVISESGARKYQKGGRGPLDNVIFLGRK